MQEIKRFGILSLAKIEALFMAVVGLFSIAGLALAKGGVNPVVLVLVPLTYAVFGFVLGAVTALLYNVFAKYVGGIKVELSGIDTDTADTTYTAGIAGDKSESEFYEENKEFTQT